MSSDYRRTVDISDLTTDTQFSSLIWTTDIQRVTISGQTTDIQRVITSEYRHTESELISLI